VRAARRKWTVAGHFDLVLVILGAVFQCADDHPTDQGASARGAAIALATFEAPYRLAGGR